MKKTYLLLTCGLSLLIIQAGAQSTPYLGKPADIPGVVFSHLYDEGGQEVAYWDQDPQSQNIPEYFRKDEWVDLEQSSLGGWNVGWTNPGEWIKYIVDIDSTASYQMEFWYASGMGDEVINKTIFEFSSGPATDTIHPNATGGWQVWEVFYDTLELTKGIDTLKFTMATGGFNFHHLDFTRINGDARVDSFMMGDSIYWGSWITEREVVVFESTPPQITEVYLSDADASSVVTDADAIPGVASIESASPDGTVTVLYTINLRLASNDGTASEILINNEPLPNFDPAVNTYDMELPEDKIPRLSATANDPNSRGVVATRPADLPGAGTIEITAEDWSVNTYTINFTVVPDVLKSVTNPSLKLYPNPAENISALDLSVFAGNAETLLIYDMYGRSVREINVRGMDEYLLDTSELPNAIYFVNLMTSEDVFTTNLVVAR